MRLMNMLSCVQVFIALVGAQNFILLYCLGDRLIFHSSLPLYSGIDCIFKKSGVFCHSIPFSTPDTPLLFFLRLFSSHISSTLSSVNSFVTARLLFSPGQLCGPSLRHQTWCPLYSTCHVVQWTSTELDDQGRVPATMVCAVAGSTGITGYENWLGVGS